MSDKPAPGQSRGLHMMRIQQLRHRINCCSAVQSSSARIMVRDTAFMFLLFILLFASKTRTRT